MNLTDHLTLVLHLSGGLLDDGDDFVPHVPDSIKSSRLTWNKADLSSYYSAINVYLGQIDLSITFTNCNVYRVFM